MLGKKSHVQGLQDKAMCMHDKFLLPSKFLTVTAVLPMW